jgi:hypothetical protein
MSDADGAGDSSRDIADAAITLESTDGSSYSCQVMAVFELDGNDYALLETTEDDLDDRESVIVRFIELGDQAGFQTIEDDAEFQRVVAYVEDLVGSLDVKAKAKE